MQIKNNIKACIAFIYYLLFILPCGTKGKRIVLFYHGVRDGEKETFKKQMYYLDKFAKALAPSRIKSHPHEEKLLTAITFDDGFENLKRNALPVLMELGIYAGFFIPSGNLGTNPAWSLAADCNDKDETIMNVKDLKYLQQQGHEIFSHTITHPYLPLLDNDKLYYELGESKKRLEELLGKPISAISYPHGACDERVFEVAEKVGYSMGFTIESRKVDDTVDSLRIGRTSVSPKDGLFIFMLKLNGAYEVFTIIRSFRRSWVRRLKNIFK